MNKINKMEKFEIQGSDKFPSVILDPYLNKYEILGRSIPENANLIYTPIMDWIENNLHQVNEPFIAFKFHLEYHNSSSARHLIALFKKLEYFNSTEKKIIINWHHEDNEDDYEVGKLYKNSCNLSFNLISIQSENEDFEI